AAMLALGREWTSRTTAERNEFVALFADLLERSFVWRVAGKANLDGGVKVQYLGETVAGDTAAVDTTVTSRDGKALRLEDRVGRAGGWWGTSAWTASARWRTTTLSSSASSAIAPGAT